MKELICFLFGHKLDTEILESCAGPSGFIQTAKRKTCRRCGQFTDWIYLSRHGKEMVVFEKYELDQALHRR